MIRVKWWAGNELKSGGSEIVGQWQQQGLGVVWVDITDEPEQSEAAFLSGLGCHPLAIQDAQRKRHPPKCEDFSDFTFVLYRGFTQFDEDIEVVHVQVAFFVGKNILITRRNGPSFGVESLWNSEADVIRYLPTPSILLTRIINVSLGGYTQRMLELEESITQMEDEMLIKPTDSIMQKLILYRSRLRKLNRIFRYHEKVFSEILKESTVTLDMKDETLYHSMQDVYDKCERLYSLGTLFYEQCGDLVESYLSLTSHQLNQTMQTLTVITAIFVPLGLLSGIYGMNFENMPELHSEYGYFILMGVMMTVITVLLTLFRRRGWL